MSQKEETEVGTIVFPEGRVINCSLFEKDAYEDAKGNKGTPSYKIEMAYDPDDLIPAEDQIVDYAISLWGPSAEDQYNDNVIKSPIIDGDKLAAKREKKGKAGDAYKGKDVIRANTQFNLHGQNAPGGVYVCGPDAGQIEAVNQSKVYNGCYGIMAGTVKEYEDNDGNKALKIYLSGFQKTKDGERLASGTDFSKVFQPVAGAASSEGGGRRRRG